MPRRVADTPTYVAASKADSLESALSGIRTMGYPLFLRALEKKGRPGHSLYARVPLAQFLIFVAGVWVFWVGLSRFMEAPWLALAASFALLWGESLTLVRRLLPDFLALAFSIAAIGLLLLLVVRRSLWLWIALAVTVFTSYQLRPAGVFMIVWVPLLALVLERLRNESTWTKSSRFALVAAALMIAPYLGFAGLRWASVGHFGLVSFGGSNAAGMALHFLDKTVVEELPPDQSSLAKAMWRSRKRRGWVAITPEDDLTALLREQYSDNIFRVARPVARRAIKGELKSSGGAVNSRELARSNYIGVETNHRLSEVSRSIVRLRPSAYLRWVANSVAEGFVSLVKAPWFRWPSLVLMFSVFLLLVRRGWRGLPAMGEDPRRRRLVGLGCLTVGHFGAYLLLVSLVSFPFPRYFTSILLFVPALLCALIFESWRLIIGLDDD